jgi:hypothetical protein
MTQGATGGARQSTSLLGTGPRSECARTLARKMATVVNGESATDAFVAAAILIAGLIASSAKNAEEASKLAMRIHRLSDQFVRAWMEDEPENTPN